MCDSRRVLQPDKAFQPCKSKRRSERPPVKPNEHCHGKRSWTAMQCGAGLWNCFLIVRPSERGDPMTNYVVLPHNKKLNLLRDHDGDWPSLDHTKWCLHCGKEFTG